MSDYDAVLFDLDGTVWEYRRSADEVLTTAFEAVGVEPYFTAAEYVDRIPKFGNEVETEAELRRRCFADVATDRDRDTATAETLADTYTAERDYRNVRLLPGAREAIDALQERYRVAAVTNNGPEAQTPKIAELELEDAFETVVYAGTMTQSKPDTEPFEVALSRVGVDAGRTIHVGNSLGSDVAGAARAGLDSVWVPEDRTAAAESHAPTYRVDALTELVEPPWE